MKKRIIILGSTGSIGTQTVEIVRENLECFEIVGLSASSNVKLLEEQIREFSPKVVTLYEQDAADAIKEKFPSLEVLSGNDGLEEIAAYPHYDLALVAIVGFYGLLPTLSAIRAKKQVALANKEALVAGGRLVMEEAERHGVTIVPIDSEQSAIFQCLQGEESKSISRIILTASGGPFREWESEDLKSITVKEALAHPTWNMGVKNTIDSSTLMNKGLEVIEAAWLFGVSVDEIDVVIHPQSIIHSLVEFCDGSMMAQLAEPDMKLPIHYALHYPKRAGRQFEPFNFTKVRSLDFFPPDAEKFPCLALALDAIKKGGSLPCYMNAANEVLVNRFSEGEFSWEMIGKKLTKLMQTHEIMPITSYQNLHQTDHIARKEALTA